MKAILIATLATLALLAGTAPAAPAADAPAAVADKDEHPLPPLPPELEAILDKLETARKKVERLSADIVQTRRVEALDIEEEYRGDLKFRMPRLLRLELYNKDRDERRIYVVNEKYAWIYRVKEKQAERFRLVDLKRNEEKSDNPFEYGLAADLRELRRKYEFKLKPDAKVGDADCAVLELNPRPDATGRAYYAKMEFWIDRKLWLPVRVVQHKSDGEVIETFTLSNLKLNPSEGILWNTWDKHFEFDPPDGVDVVKHDMTGGVQ